MRKTTLALLACLLPSLAAAQQINLPANTVYGRLAIPSTGGPGVAIPFSILAGQLAGSIPNGTITNAMLANATANTVKCNPTTSAATPQDCAVGNFFSAMKPLTSPVTSAITMGPWGYQITGCGNPNWYADGRTSTVTVSIASPAVVHWVGHGLKADQPVYFKTTGTLPTGILPMQAGPNALFYVLAAGLGADDFEISVNVAAGAAVNTSGTQSGTHTAFNSCAQVLGLTSFTHYDTSSVFYIEAVGGGAGACKNVGGGGAGGSVYEYLTNLPQTAQLLFDIGGSGFGCRGDSAPITPTNGGSAVVSVFQGTPFNGQTILTAENGHKSANANGGPGGNVTGCSGFVDDASGYCIRQAQQLNNAGDGSHWGLNGSMGGASIRGGGLNRTGGGGANGSGAGYSMVDNYGYDGFRPEILIKCVYGCW